MSVVEHPNSLVLCLVPVWAQEFECSKKQRRLQSGDFVARVHVGHILPVHNPEPIYMSPPHRTRTLNELGTTELVVQVVGVLPDVADEERPQSL